MIYPVLYITMGLMVIPWIPLGVLLHAMRSQRREENRLSGNDAAVRVGECDRCAHERGDPVVVRLGV